MEEGKDTIGKQVRQEEGKEVERKGELKTRDRGEEAENEIKTDYSGVKLMARVSYVALGMVISGPLGYGKIYQQGS